MIKEKKKPELNPRDTTEPGEIHDTFVKERNFLKISGFSMDSREGL